MDSVRGHGRRGEPPGIAELLRLSEEHRGEFEYDWRTRFACPFDPGVSMSWGESYRLMLILAGDPSSRVGAALAGWSWPASREALVLADLYDAFISAHTRKGRAKPYPRPWDEKGRTRFGRTTRSQEEVRAALRARGHDI